MTPRKVVLWDPNLRLRSALELALRRSGFNVLVSPSELDALRIAREESPTFGLLSARPSVTDLQSDPFATCALLVRQQAVKVCVMGALRPTRDMLIRAARAGALDFVVHPVPEKALAKRLDAAYVRARQRTQAEPEFTGIKFPPGVTDVEQKIDTIVRHASTVRAMPHAVSKVLQATEDQRTGARELATAVESDPGIAVFILKMARSPLYGGAKSVYTIRQAVTRLGFWQTKQLVLGLSVVRIMPAEGKCFGLNRLWYWLHSLAYGLLAKLLSRRLSTGDSQNAFLAGLLHDVGKIFLDDFLPEDYQLVVQKANVDRRRLFDVERESLNRDHGWVGAQIALQWGFPEEISNAIGEHHDLAQVIQHGRRPLNCTALVCLANQLVKALLIGCGGDFIVDELPLSVWSAAGFSDLEDSALLRRFHQELEEFSRFLGTDPIEVQQHRSANRLAAVVAPATRSTILTSLALGRLGYKVTRAPELEAVTRDVHDRALCLVHTDSLDEGRTAIATLESNGWRYPVVCVVQSKPSGEADLIDDSKPWLRAVYLPLDCYDLSSAVQNAESSFEGKASEPQPDASPADRRA